MDYGLIVGKRIIIMFIILLIGALCFFRGIITKDGTKQLSKVALEIVNPLLIFMSYQADYTDELLSGLLWSFLLSAISFAIAIIVSMILIKPKGEDYSIERFSAIYSNCAFICIPIINGLYGAEGVLYLTAYLTFFNLLVWTHGIMLMKGEKDFSSFKKALRSPSVIAVFLGLICYIFQLRLPTVPAEALDFIASMNTPLAMLIAGATIAQINLAKCFKNGRIFYISFIRLILIPVLVLLAIGFLPATDMVKMTVIVATACPTATIGTMMALSLDKNADKCSEIFAVTTLLSAITVPMMVVFTQMFL